MPNKKLATLKLNLPILPATAVGSLPKPAEIKELKFKVKTGFSKQEDLERKQKMATEIWIRQQERIGLDVLVDGEIFRSDMISYFAERIDGFDPGGNVRCYGNRYYKKPIIKGKLGWKKPLMSESWKMIQRMTHRPLKAVLTGPYTLMAWSFDDYYGSRESVCADLTAIIKKEIRLLVEAGAKIIQIDDPALSERPHEFSMVLNSIKEITEGLSNRCYFILHHAYGDLTPVWQKMQRLPVDNFDLDTFYTEDSILPLLKKIPTNKDISVGVVDSHHHKVEPIKEVEARLRAALRFIPAKQVWVSPDCGLRTRSNDEALKKLTHLTQTAQKFRKKYK